MDILEAKLAVIKAGIMLVENGLIQRTWGNVSCRIDDNHFVKFVFLNESFVVIKTMNEIEFYKQNQLL